MKTTLLETFAKFDIKVQRNQIQQKKKRTGVLDIFHEIFPYFQCQFVTTDVVSQQLLIAGLFEVHHTNQQQYLHQLCSSTPEPWLQTKQSRLKLGGIDFNHPQRLNHKCQNQSICILSMLLFFFLKSLQTASIMS